MFISSATRKKPRESNLNYNLRPLPMRGTNRRNPDEDFVLNGRRTSITNKPKKYRTNTQLTMTRPGTSTNLEKSVSKTAITEPLYNDSDSSSEPHYQADTDEFEDGPEPELTRLKEDTIYVADPEETAWYLNPPHLPQNPQLVLEQLCRKSPLQASVVRSAMEGSLYPVPQEVIDNTPIESFDVSLFQNAEEEMLSCRSLTALASPYQYKLAQLKMERLRIEEERLIQTKALSELERIRGPTPRWYEMKTRGFHIEAKKNNQLLASQGNYKEIMNYRHELLRTLEGFERTDLL